MKRPGPQPPSFFWQGVFMMLPVLALAGFGVFTLYQDRHYAYLDGLQRTQENLQVLTRALELSVNEQIRKYDDLQSRWSQAILESSVPTNSRFLMDEARLRLEFKWWEQEHPNIGLEERVLPTLVLDGEGNSVYPAEIPAAPSPPPWYTQMSPSQRQMWDAIRSGREADGSKDLFLASHPSTEAVRAVAYLKETPEKILNDTTFSAETGIPFQDITCFRLLQARKSIPMLVWNQIWQRVFVSPSFAAPEILQMIETWSGPRDPDHWLGSKIPLMQRAWENQNTARELAAQLRAGVPGRGHWTAAEFTAPRWLASSNSFVLAIFSEAGNPTNNQPATNAWSVHFIPEPVVQSMFQVALAQNRVLLPDYVEVSIDAQNVAMIGSANASNSAWVKETNMVNQASSELPFSLTPWLSTGKMMEAENRRSRILSALIGAIVLTAVAGLLAARRAFYEQARLSEMKSNFVSSVSHELRAPIASMRLLSEALERGKVSDSARQQEYYRFLVQESRRLTSLIENVLDFSRIDQGRKEYRFETADLDALGEQTVRLLQPYAGEHQVTLRWQPAVEPAPPLTCDGPALQQALINLIDNAVKHSPAGAEVLVGLDAAGGLERLWVEDHGPGIPAEDHEKIFERFYRRGSELRRETQGIGIGLTIVKHIVEAHRGAVRVRSAPGQGSRFTIELPLRPVPV